MTSASVTSSEQSGRVKRIFRVWSQFYDNPVAQNLFYRRVHARLLKRVGAISPETILDVGCGTGELFDKTSKRWPNAHYVGLDLSAEMLAVGEEKYRGNARVSFLEGSAEDIELPDNSIGLLTNTISSHFYPDLDAVLGEFSRVLKPGGTLAMACLNNGLLGWLPGPYQKQFSASDINLRSDQLHKQMLAKNGFVDVHRYRLPANVSIFVAANAARQ